MTEWIRVSKADLCEICQKEDWCTYSQRYACCMRTESPKPCRNGGWIHRLSDDRPVMSRPVQRKPKEIKDVSKIYAKYEGNNLPALSKALGLSVRSLCRVRAGYNGQDWTFPMFNGYNRMVGIRLRSNQSKQKTLTGTHNGLFIPELYESKHLFICEGPTDLCAIIDLGFQAIGRPSCSGGTDYIKQFLRTKRDIVIACDNDKWKTRPDGSRFKPGQEGAARLAKEILPFTKSVCIIKPAKHKDMRDWYLAGAAKDDVIRMVRNSTTVYNRPRR